jgi:translation elongation factor EF-Tu-like GTPase
MSELPICPYHVEATITFLRTEEGGRRTPASSGYRPQFYYEGENWDAIHYYPGMDQVYPGDTVTVHLGFLSPEYHRGRIQQGTRFEIREGRRVVGRGVVTKLLNL